MTTKRKLPAKKKSVKKKATPVKKAVASKKLSKPVEAKDTKSKKVAPQKVKVADKQDKSERSKLMDMEVADLKAKYEEVVGRPTKSDNKNYLVWKITQGLAGKLPEPKPRRPVDPNGFKVIPLRLGKTNSDALDEVIKSSDDVDGRSDFLRKAIADQLASMGETTLSEKFLASESA